MASNDATLRDVNAYSLLQLFIFRPDDLMSEVQSPVAFLPQEESVILNELLASHILTAGGYRCVKSWMLIPLCDRELIKHRQGAIELLLCPVNDRLVENISSLMSCITDIPNILLDTKLRRTNYFDRFCQLRIILPAAVEIFGFCKQLKGTITQLRFLSDLLSPIQIGAIQKLSYRFVETVDFDKSMENGELELLVSDSSTLMVLDDEVGL